MLEYKHMFLNKPKKQKGEFYISVNADVNKPISTRDIYKLPIIKRGRFGANDFDPLQIEFKRRRNNFSLSKVKHKLELPSKFYPSLESNLEQYSVIRKYNSSVDHQMSNRLHKTPEKSRMNQMSKRTLPNTRLQMMMNNDSSVILPQTIDSLGPKDKLVVFEILNHKTTNDYKFPVTMDDPTSHEFRVVSVQQIIDICNEDVADKQYKSNHKSSFESESRIFVSTSSNNSDYEDFAPYHFVYTAVSII
jgi:hypothetical protein